MKIRWISLLVLLVLTLTGCTSISDTSNSASENTDIASIAPEGRVTEDVAANDADSSKSDPFLTQLPAPTVGSVVITNTTANPISSANSASALTPAPILQSLAQSARQDLANRLNVSLDQIDLLKIVPAMWPYDSVGCPMPTVDSIEPNKPGYQILLNAYGQVYMYHTDGKDWVDLCTVKPTNEIRTLP